MSKSVGNVIDPLALLEEYGTDAVRYFLARHIHPFEDSDFTMERFKDAYNADLANGLGNVVARVMQLAETYLDAPIFSSRDQLAFDYSPKFKESISQYDFNASLSVIFSYVSRRRE